MIIGVASCCIRKGSILIDAEVALCQLMGVPPVISGSVPTCYCYLAIEVCTDCCYSVDQMRQHCVHTQSYCLGTLLCNTY
ncbi:hypothetical protein BC832DRAFT_568163, partial [Gaertneriomyces semiglobifer]